MKKRKLKKESYSRRKTDKGNEDYLILLAENKMAIRYLSELVDEIGKNIDKHLKNKSTIIFV